MIETDLLNIVLSALQAQERATVSARYATKAEATAAKAAAAKSVKLVEKLIDSFKIVPVGCFEYSPERLVYGVTWHKDIVCIKHGAVVYVLKSDLK